MKKLLLVFLLIALALSLVLLRSNRKPFPNPSANLTTPEAATPEASPSLSKEIQTSVDSIVLGKVEKITGSEMTIRRESQNDSLTFYLTSTTTLWRTQLTPTSTTKEVTDSANPKVTPPPSPTTIDAKDIKVGDNVSVRLKNTDKGFEAISVYVLEGL